MSALSPDELISILEGETFVSLARKRKVSGTTLREWFFKAMRRVSHPRFGPYERQYYSHTLAAYRRNANFWRSRIEAYREYQEESRKVEIAAHRQITVKRLDDICRSFARIRDIEAADVILTAIERLEEL